MKEFKEIETTKENGLDPYRYLLWGVAKRTQVERDGHNMGGTPHAVHALDKCGMSKD